MRLAVSMHHYGTGAMLDQVHKVLPKDPHLLYIELNNLLNTRVGRNLIRKRFTTTEQDLMLPVTQQTDSGLFDITLINKIVLACRDAAYSFNGQAFAIPTGLVFDASNLPSLATANTGDFLQLLKELRNFILHAPAQEVLEQDFNNLWTFMASIFQALGYNAPELAELEKGSIVNQRYIQALLKSVNDFFTQLKQDTTTLVTSEVSKNYGSLQNNVNYLNHFLALLASQTTGAKNELDTMKISVIQMQHQLGQHDNRLLEVEKRVHALSGVVMQPGTIIAIPGSTRKYIIVWSSNSLFNGEL